MKTSAWCPVDPRLRISPPLIRLERSADLTDLVIEQFADEGRYVMRDLTGDGKPETCCNFLLIDTLEAQGVVIPRDAAGNYRRANDLVRTYFGSTAPWELVSPWVAQQLVRVGVPCVVGQVNTSGPGHVARLVAPRHGEDPKGWYIAQAGRENFTHGKLEHGFGRNAQGLVFAVHP